LNTGYLLALGVTIGVECPIVALLYARQRLRLALACAFATTATHLIVHFGLPQFFREWLVAGEVFATLAEALVYALVARPRDVGRALVASALANSASFGAGFLLFGS
jgi:hypothetical protein